MTIAEVTDRLAHAGLIVKRVWPRGRWIEVVDRQGGELVIGAQNPHAFHAFWTFEGTASGSTPERATDGGLGDAITTDAEMRGYLRLVFNAPAELIRKYAGLYRASSDEFNRRMR